MDKSEEQQFQEWETKSNSRWANIGKNFSPVHIFLFILAFFVLYYFYSTGSVNNILFIGAILALIAVVIFMLKKPGEKKLIPEHIIKRIAQEALERKKGKELGIPFDCKVNVTLVGEVIYEQDMISQTSGVVKREVGFEVINKGYPKKGVIGVHPYDGTILGIRWEKLGYTGKETKDTKIIPVGVFPNPQNPNNPKI